jgi:hypothetical protein
MKEIDLITEEDLEKKLSQEQKKGSLRGGEHCFRNEYNWYELNFGYTNPLNTQTVHAELFLITSLEKKILEFMRKRHHIFFGVGVGDTEIAFLDQAIKLGEKEIFCTGIDVNKTFLENFAESINNKIVEDDNLKIDYQAIHALFEQITRNHLQVGKPNNLYCLGGTIGNFLYQQEIFRMFSELSNKGDNLIIGYQHISQSEVLLRKYQRSKLFENFILNYIPKEQRGEVIWSLGLDENRGIITATHKGIEVFRSTKYNSDFLRRNIERKGFKILIDEVDRYNNAGLQVYQRI